MSKTEIELREASFTQQDLYFMQRALALARQGIALTSPNPCVGAVVVSSGGEVVGSGSHTYDGIKHAEVLAIEQAGGQARGASLYINLEPCCHLGRTGPCVEAIIRAGIVRVVAAMQDPNPEVGGRGFERLRSAGISVEVGLCDAEARALNESFAKYIRTGTPLVTLKAGMTLDGKIAPPPGESGAVSALGAAGAASGWITSEEARAHVQEQRHASDAILSGVGTVVADDPLLTDRTGRPRRRPLLRIVLDSRLRLPLESRIVKTAAEGNDVLVFCSFVDEKRREELLARGVRVEQAPLGIRDGRPDLRVILKRLGELEITSLLVEGGSLVNWSALESGIVDKIFLYYAPKILGGTGSLPFASGSGFRRVSEAATIRNIQLHRFGEDFAVEGYIKDPYRE